MITNTVFFVLIAYMETWFIESITNKVTTKSLTYLAWFLNLNFMITLATIDTGKMNGTLHSVCAVIFFVGYLPYMFINNAIVKNIPSVANGTGYKIKKFILKLYLGVLVALIVTAIVNK
jgi:hypothetical protein